MPKTLKEIFIPELERSHQGKVRDLYEREDELIFITSDRISCFDCVLEEAIPHKGHVLNALSAYWLNETKDIVPNHLISMPDANVVINRRCKALPIEIIVRNFMTGSMWQDYKGGMREKSGVPLPDGLEENQQLPHPIVTPTTKATEGHDEDISAKEIIAQGIVSKELWKEIEQTALALFKRGQERSSERGLILVDTKYEFGLTTEGDLILIDEIHTPDSSRFWFSKDHASKQLRWPNKEFVREWLRERNFVGNGKPPQLPADLVDEVSRRYISVYEAMLGKPFEAKASEDVEDRLYQNLVEAKLIKGRFALVIAGSRSDEEHVNKIAGKLKELDVPHRIIYGSAHKQPEMVADLIEDYNRSVEPLVAITVAGRSNALSGVMAANLKWPVIACPPFKDHSDYLVNIHSSLQMPSQVPAMTVIDPKNAAIAAAKILACSRIARN